MQIFSFDSDVARDVGVNAAVLFYNIAWWIEKNKANNVNFHDGDYWTYNSMKAYTEMFPFMSKKTIETAIGLLNSIINCILLVITNKISKRVAETSLW